jgi:hypothetical protein
MTECICSECLLYDGCRVARRSGASGWTDGRPVCASMFAPSRLVQQAARRCSQRASCVMGSRARGLEMFLRRVNGGQCTCHASEV